MYNVRMTTAAVRKVRPPHLPGRWIVVSIGIFKLFKGLLMILTAVAAMQLMRQSVADAVHTWASDLAVDLDVGPYRRRLGEFVVGRVLNLSNKALVAVIVGAAFYATLFITEGLGLLFDKLWAEWMVVISSGGLMPVEVWEFCHRPGWLAAGAFVVNVALVIYLAVRVRNRMKKHYDHLNSTGAATSG